MGDFNINLFYHNISPPDENFITQMISRNFFPISTCPTRVTLNSSTQIDFTIYNMVEEIESSGVKATNISDHFPVFSREKLPALTEESMSINYRVFFRCKPIKLYNFIARY